MSEVMHRRSIEAATHRPDNAPADAAGRNVAVARPVATFAEGAVAAAALTAKLVALQSAEYSELKTEWRRLFRSPPPGRIGRDILELGIAWKLQEQMFGGLSALRKRRLAELGATIAANGDLGPTRAVRLKPGARLVREWGGVTHDVLVMTDGFEWRGERWRSLTAIAVAITGAHWSGPRFFGLADRAAAQNSKPARGVGRDSTAGNLTKLPPRPKGPLLAVSPSEMAGDGKEASRA